MGRAEKELRTGGVLVEECFLEDEEAVKGFSWDK